MADQTTGPDDTGYDAMTFEQLLGGLEEITDRLASSDIGIEEAADLYEQAERLHGLAAARLTRVQARIETLAAAATPALSEPATGA